MNRQRVMAITRKEAIQIWRDPRSLIIVILIPLVQLIMFGYAVNLDVRHIPLCIYDRDGTQSSQDLLKRFAATDYFELARLSESYADVVRSIDLGTCTVAVVVPPRFSENLHSGNNVSVQALLDASDNNTANIGIGYTHTIVQAYSSSLAVEWLERKGFTGGQPAVKFQPRTWYNEDLESMANFVPGVVAVVMAMVGAFLTSLTIAREWERGTMEQLVSTPVTKAEIQIGKLLPYFVIGMGDTALCTTVALWWFDVPFRGRWSVLFGSSAMFLTVVLSLGYYISVITKSQLGASQVAVMATLMPTLLLSGFIFPIDQMPIVVQWISRVLPAPYYVSIVRNVFLKGTEVELLVGHLLALGIIAAVLVTLSTRSFQKRLE